MRAAHFAEWPAVPAALLARSLLRYATKGQARALRRTAVMRHPVSPRLRRAHRDNRIPAGHYIQLRGGGISLKQKFIYSLKIEGYI